MSYYRCHLVMLVYLIHHCGTDSFYPALVIMLSSLEAKSSTLGSFKCLLLKQLKHGQVTRAMERKRRKVTSKLQSSQQTWITLHTGFLILWTVLLFPTNLFLHLYALSYKSNANVWMNESYYFQICIPYHS